MPDTEFFELITERLRLRRLVPADCPAMFAYRSDPSVVAYQTWEPRDLTEIERFVADQMKLHPDTPDSWFQLAITSLQTNELVGDCGLHFPADEEQQAEIGITIAPAWQRHGFAAETVSAGFGYLFDTLDKHRVYASVDPRNTPSVALLERLGMRREAHFRESFLVRGEWTDDLIYALLQREWRLR